uniref:Uncharacterized protein n=1 Tax=Anopheles farauti TaxID=69004 RepID=A0A182QF73_9DIPT
MQLRCVSLVCVLVLGASVIGAPRVRRSSAGEGASSYFYFSRSPGQFGAPFGGELPTISALLPEAKHFPVVHGKDETDGASAFGGKVLAEHSDEEGDDGDDHEAYRVVEYDHERDGGSSYAQDHHAKKGDKAEKGYDRKHAVEHGSKGSYGKEDHGHHYAHEGDRKQSHHDEGSHYHDHHAEAKRTKGGKHHEKKHHKKGSKTTGYHNVYHKDEYKKEHIFYDTSDHSGQFKKYGSAHEHHSNEAGQRASGGHLDQAHREQSHKKAGNRQHGSYDRQHGSHENRHGHDHRQHDVSSYDRTHGHTGEAERGYKIVHPLATRYTAPATLANGVWMWIYSHYERTRLDREAKVRDDL